MLCQKCGFSNNPTAKFCRQCGDGLAHATSAAQAPAPATAQHIPTQETAAAACPQCGASRVPGKRFCRSCRFDFAAQNEGEAAVVGAPEEAVKTSPEVAAAPASAVVPPQALDVAAATTGSTNPAERHESQTGQSSETRFTHAYDSAQTPDAMTTAPAHTPAPATSSATASGQSRGGNKAWIIGGAAAVVVIGVAVGAGIFLGSQHGPAATKDAAASVPAAVSTPPAAAASEQVAAAPAPASTSPDAASNAAAAPSQTVAASETSAAPPVATAATQPPQPASASEAPAIAQAGAASAFEAPAAPTAITGGPQVMTSEQDIKLRDCAGARCATLLIIPKGTRLTVDPATIKVVTEKSGTQMPWARISYQGLYCPVGTACRHMVRAQMAMDGWLDVKSLVPVTPGN
jgi:hypothetical protein